MQRAELASALTGNFGGTINIPETDNLPLNLALKVVMVDGELIGQLIAQRLDPDVAMMLPSFVRLRPAAKGR